MTSPLTGTRLAVVLGNTTCRMALMDGTEPRAAFVMSHAELMTEDASLARIRALCGGEEVEEAGLCSVVPKLESLIGNLLQAAGITRLQAVRPAASSFFPTEYRSMDTLGADRYCGVLAARERYGAPVIVVDCGTATTINVVDARGVFLGGAIAPGVETALRALHERTAQLPFAEISKKDVPLIGGDTGESLRSGALHFNRYALEGMVAEMKKHIGDKTPLILTGGNAPVLLAAGLRCAPQVFDAELLFRGIIFHLLFRG
ncbi:MAG: type III pantothenate kinase [Bacteroidetes bacterium]|nr:type III pantothenate kinase [Bacteroidota bacterium]